MGKQNKKDIEKVLYNERSLSLLNIRELRDMGRKFGVPSPTTKTKQELVEYILKIVYGEAKASESVYGRPHVREFDINKYIDKIQRKSVIEPSSLRLVINDSVYMSKVSEPAVDYDVGETIEQRVFVEEDGKYYLRIHAFVATENDIEVPENFVKKYKLENLDMVEIMFLGEAMKIVSINGVKVEHKFDELNLDGEKIKGGTSNIFHYSTKEEIDKEIKKLTNYCTNIKAKVYLFSTENCADATTVVFDEKDNGSTVYKKLMQFVGLCEKQSFELEEFVMIIDRADLIDEQISSLEKDVVERIKKHLQETIQNIISAGNVLQVYYLDKEFTY